MLQELARRHRNNTRYCHSDFEGTARIEGRNTGTINIAVCTKGQLQELVVFTGKMTNTESMVPSTSFAIPSTSFAHLSNLSPLQELVSCPAGQQYDNEAGQCAVIITNTGTMNISLI